MTISQWLETLLSLMDFGSVKVEELAADKLGNRWLVIDSAGLSEEQVNLLTGENGSGLDALQYFVNLAFDQGHTYIVELNGFRQRQLNILHDMAIKAVNHVRENKGSFSISRLSPGERRYIHLLLQEYADVESFSEGEEPNRQLIVRSIGAKDA
ncbi:MAG: RNA-binding protein [Cyanobacteria bacterium M5B4]|nr:RNA-binding protein [Cyanobacteria bacterium KgW148]PLS69162.1 MAG: RNA-binding protein [Cyanobacteria bacterium M5B4]